MWRTYLLVVGPDTCSTVKGEFLWSCLGYFYDTFTNCNWAKLLRDEEGGKGKIGEGGDYISGRELGLIGRRQRTGVGEGGLELKWSLVTVW